MMGTQRNQSIFGTPSVFMYSRPAQESNQRRNVNQMFWALVGCRIRTSDMRGTSSQNRRAAPDTHNPVELNEAAALVWWFAWQAAE